MHSVSLACKVVMHLQARRYLAANPGQANGGEKNAAAAAQMLCGKRQRDGVSTWQGRLSVKSHKGIEGVAELICSDWPDHIAK